MTLERMEELLELAAELISDKLTGGAYVDDIGCSEYVLEIPVYKNDHNRWEYIFRWSYDEDSDLDDEAQLRKAISNYYFR